MSATRWPRTGISRLGGAAIELLLPPRCPVCRRLGRARLCTACLQAVRPLPAARCAVCGDPAVRVRGRCAACAARRPAFRRAFAAGQYRGTLGGAVRALKYARRRAAAPALAALLAEAIPPAVRARVDAVVAVPCHPARLRARGIDHTALLADALARALERPGWGALARTSSTEPQVGLTRRQRRRNVANAFTAVRDVRGRRILLVDDVMTTGATAGACAAALRAAGARTVWVATAARAFGPAVAAPAAARYNAAPHAMKETRDGR